MTNSLADLNTHLFNQLDRLANKDLTPEQIEVEVKRTDAIVAVSDQVVATGNIALKAAHLVATHGDRFRHDLPMLTVKTATAEAPSAKVIG